jgi:hypothetical protein
MFDLLVQSRRVVKNERRLRFGYPTHVILFAILGLILCKRLWSEFMMQYNRREQFANHGPCERVSKRIVVRRQFRLVNGTAQY